MKLLAVSGFKREVLGCVVSFNLLVRGVLWDLVARVGFCFGHKTKAPVLVRSVVVTSLGWSYCLLAASKEENRGVTKRSLPDGGPLTAFLF